MIHLSLNPLLSPAPFPYDEISIASKLDSSEPSIPNNRSSLSNLQIHDHGRL